MFASLDRKSTKKPLSFSSGQNEKDNTTGTRENTHPAPTNQEKELSNRLDEKTQTGTSATPSPSSPPPSSSTNEETAWDFESFLEEQRRKDLQHDDRKEKAFQRVLSALGANGDLSDAPELPPEIVQAWGARNEKLSLEAGNAQKRQQKLEVKPYYVVNAVNTVLCSRRYFPSMTPPPSPVRAWACRQRLGEGLNHPKEGRILDCC